MIKRFEICEKSLLAKLLSKYIKIIVFGIFYWLLTSIVQELFHDKNSLGIALVILAICGILYTAFILLHGSMLAFLYTKVEIEINQCCIGKARSMDYGEII